MHNAIQLEEPEELFQYPMEIKQATKYTHNDSQIFHDAVYTMHCKTRKTEFHLLQNYDKFIGYIKILNRNGKIDMNEE